MIFDTFLLVIWLFCLQFGYLDQEILPYTCLIWLFLIEIWLFFYWNVAIFARNLTVSGWNWKIFVSKSKSYYFCQLFSKSLTIFTRNSAIFTKNLTAFFREFDYSWLEMWLFRQILGYFCLTKLSVFALNMAFLLKIWPFSLEIRQF